MLYRIRKEYLASHSSTIRIPATEYDDEDEVKLKRLVSSGHLTKFSFISTTTQAAPFGFWECTLTKRTMDEATNEKLKSNKTSLQASASSSSTVDSIKSEPFLFTLLRQFPSKKAVQPDGVVIQGDYEGLYVYIWEPRKSLKIIEGLYDPAFFAAPYYIKATIDIKTVDHYQLISSMEGSAITQKNFNTTSFVYGPLTALSLVNASKTMLHTVAIYFKDGKKCIVELLDPAFHTLQTGCFQL